MTRKGRRGSGLDEEERAVWHHVTKTVKPLDGRRSAPPPHLQPAPLPLPATKPAAAQPVQAPASLKPKPPAASLRTGRQAAAPAIEGKLLKALRRGQVAIDRHLDLHGETQARAHRSLEAALVSAQARGDRILLIVTGTGLRRRLGEAEEGRPLHETPGVLRRALPHWLAEAPFADLVLGLSPAGPAHGGTGAFYVQLRRRRAR